MIIKNTISAPAILTIPDDAIIFSLLINNDPISEKIIAENYINFYSVRSMSTGEVVLRFENMIDYESIYGIERLFIPIELLQTNFMDKEKLFNMIVELLSNSFILSVPVSKECLSFYDNNAGTHRLLLFGVDNNSKIFFCKDFKNFEFTEFNATLDELASAITMYSNPTARESDGLWAFKLSNSVLSAINLSKIYIEFVKLYYGKKVGSFDAYGVDAIKFFLDDVDGAIFSPSLMDRWFEVANYLRESSKLMSLRFSIIFRSNQLEVSKIKTKVRELQVLTDKLYFSIFRLLSLPVCKEEFAILPKGFRQIGLSICEAYREISRLAIEKLAAEN